MARTLLPAREAPNEGVRLLRVQLRFKNAEQLAKELACDATAIRRWAKGKRTPGGTMRDRMYTTLGIPVVAWEETLTESSALTLPRR